MFIYDNDIYTNIFYNNILFLPNNVFVFNINTFYFAIQQEFN